MSYFQINNKTSYNIIITESESDVVILDKILRLSKEELENLIKLIEKNK